MDPILQYGSLCEGDFGAGLFCRTSLAEGDFWAELTAPHYLVYRSKTDGTYDYTLPIAVMSDGATTIAIGSQALASDITYGYEFRGISPRGSLGDASDELLIRVDGSGDIYWPYDNDIHHLTGAPIKGGKIRLTWIFDATEGDLEPDGFNYYKYSDAVWTKKDSDAFAYRGRFSWLSAVLSDATRYTYKVTTFKGAFESAGLSVSVEADNAGPPAVTGIITTST